MQIDSKTDLVPGDDEWWSSTPFVWGGQRMVSFTHTCSVRCLLGNSTWVESTDRIDDPRVNIEAYQHSMQKVEPQYYDPISDRSVSPSNQQPSHLRFELHPWGPPSSSHESEASLASWSYPIIIGGLIALRVPSWLDRGPRYVSVGLNHNRC